MREQVIRIGLTGEQVRLCSLPILILFAAILAILPLLGCNARKNDTSIVIPPNNAPGVIDTDPSWSPTDGRIAFTRYAWSSPPDSFFQLWIVDAVSGVSGFVTFGSEPAWSPDGVSITFIRHGDVHTLDLPTSNTQRLTDWGSCFSPAWSPDGRYIAFDVLTNPPAVPKDSSGIWILDVETLLKRQLVRFSGRTPAWSPDGLQLAFMQASGDIAPFNEIAMLDVSDSSLTRLTFNASDDRNPSWSPDGRMIAWSAYAPGDLVGNIWLMDADGSQQRILTRAGRSPDWSPDATEIVYSGLNADSNTLTLWLIDALGTDKRPLTSGAR